MEGIREGRASVKEAMPAGTGKQVSVALWVPAVPRFLPSENILFTSTGVGRMVGASKAGCGLLQVFSTNSCCRIACNQLVFSGPEGLASAGCKNYALINKRVTIVFSGVEMKLFVLSGEFISLGQPSKIRIPSICS